MRPKLLAGNWKMNKSSSDLAPFFAELTLLLNKKLSEVKNQVEVLFAVPYTLLQKAAELAKPHAIRIAAQNVHQLDSGAYTGEVSLPMLLDIGINATLIGHSERRQYYGETDASVAAKTSAALAKGVTPIACVGETLAEREADQTEVVLKRQVEAIFKVLTTPGNLIIAYEPVWAIGTGHSATMAQAQEAHAFIRSLIKDSFGAPAAQATRILYGGSANPANISELLAQPDIDGGLVGGASLKAADFATMIQAAW